MKTNEIKILNYMKPIHVICDDEATKAALEKRLQAEGFAVAKEPLVAPLTLPKRGELNLLCTPAATNAVLKLDESLVGTADYMGLAYFWACEYRHYLRDCTPAARCAVHDRWLAEGLALDGESDRHLEIIGEATGLQ